MYVAICRGVTLPLCLPFKSNRKKNNHQNMNQIGGDGSSKHIRINVLSFCIWLVGLLRSLTTHRLKIINKKYKQHAQFKQFEN